MHPGVRTCYDVMTAADLGLYTPHSVTPADLLHFSQNGLNAASRIQQVHGVKIDLLKNTVK